MCIRVVTDVNTILHVTKHVSTHECARDDEKGVP